MSNIDRFGEELMKELESNQTPNPSPEDAIGEIVAGMEARLAERIDKANKIMSDKIDKMQMKEEPEEDNPEDVTDDNEEEKISDEEGEE